MNSTLNAMVATERQHQLITEAAEYRRGRKAAKRTHRVSRFLKDVAAASL